MLQCEKEDHSMRCSWAKSKEAIKYHDHQWCKETHDEKMLFKMLVLEGMQAGLSWDTILKKEEAYNQTFDDFDYHKIASYSKEKIESLYEAEGIIHNHLKINSIIVNAKAFLSIQEEFGSFDHYIWSFVDYKMIDHRYVDEKEIPASDALSTKISQDMKKRGFKFVGPVIIYSYLQAIGIYNDHLMNCEWR